MLLYGLRSKKTGDFVTVRYEDNGEGRAIYCDTSVYLESGGKFTGPEDISKLWLLDSAENVIHALCVPTPMYNADTKETPCHSLDKDEFEIFELEISLNAYRNLTDKKWVQMLLRLLNRVLGVFRKNRQPGAFNFGITEKPEHRMVMGSLANAKTELTVYGLSDIGQLDRLSQEEREAILSNAVCRVQIKDERE